LKGYFTKETANTIFLVLWCFFCDDLHQLTIYN